MKLITLAMMLTLSLPLAVHSEIDRSQAPEGGALPAKTFPKFDTKQLSNGLKVFLLPSHRQPMITYRLMFDVRPVDPELPAGVGDLVAALLNKGTAVRDADAFAEATDFIGASVEADHSDDAVVIYASGLSKFSQKILDLLTEAVTQPAFPADHLEKERAKLYARLESERKEPDSLTEKLKNRVVFGDKHPYAAFPTPESVGKISRENVLGFYKSVFSPANASIVVVGDFDEPKMLQQLEETLGKWKAEPAAARVVEVPKPLEGITIHLVDRPESVQSNIVVAKTGVARNYAKTPEMMLLNVVLGGGFSGRLFQNLRERNAFTYGSYSEFNRKRVGGVFAASAEVRNEVTGPAVQEILNELSRIVSEPIPEGELKLNKTYLAGNFLLSLESDRRTAERIQELDFYAIAPDFYETYVSRVEKADASELQKIAGELLKPSDLAVIVVGKADEIQGQLEKIGKVIRYDENLQPVAPKQ